MAACGLVLKLPVRWASSSDGPSILNAAGSISSEWASPSKFPDHVTTKPIQQRQEAFKRELPEQVRQVQQAHPTAQVELWAMDEHRVGLKPIIRRVWARRGQRPIIRVHQRYEWLYLYGFVHPESGESQWLLLPSVSVEAFSIALAHFAQAVGAGPDRHVILVRGSCRLA